VRPAAEAWPVSDERFGSWNTLRDSLLRMVHGAMSAVLAPEFDLDALCQRAAGVEVERARQLGSLVPKVTPGAVGLSDFRKQLAAFSTSTLWRFATTATPPGTRCPSSFRTMPKARATPTSSCWATRCWWRRSTNPAASARSICRAATGPTWKPTKSSRAKRTIAVETKSLPVFARNGSIVPLDSAVRIDLHYFPSWARVLPAGKRRRRLFASARRARRRHRAAGD
jgi:hypothetical protein